MILCPRMMLLTATQSTGTVCVPQGFNLLTYIQRKSDDSKCLASSLDVPRLVLFLPQVSKPVLSKPQLVHEVLGPTSDSLNVPQQMCSLPKHVVCLPWLNGIHVYFSSGINLLMKVIHRIILQSQQSFAIIFLTTFQQPAYYSVCNRLSIGLYSVQAQEYRSAIFN